jgi:adenosine kinase
MGAMAKHGGNNGARGHEVVVTGSVAWDCIMSFTGKFAEHIVPEKLHTLNVSFLVDRMRKIRGGCAANIAYSCALHGLKPRLLASVGSDWAEYKTWLDANGIDTSLVRVHDDVLTASCVITTDAGGGQIVGFFPGAMARSRDLSLKELDRKPGLVIVSPNDPEAMKRYPAECRELDIPFIYDPGQQLVALDGPSLADGMKGARCVVVNEYEFEVAQKKTGLGPADMLDLAEAVVVTLGEHGSRIYARKSLTPIEAPAARLEKPGEPVGAGDSYRGGLIRGLARGLDWADCARLGALTASYCIEGGGTTVYSFERAGFAKRYEQAFGSACPALV